MGKKGFDFLFGDGIAYHGPLRVFLSPVNYFLYGIYHNSRNKSKKDLVDSFRECSKYDAKILCDMLKKNYCCLDDKNILLDYLEIISSWGYGKVKLCMIVDSRVIFSIKKPFISNLYRKFFGCEPSFCIEEILAVFIENFLSNLYGKKFHYDIIKNGNELIFEYFRLDEDYFFETNRGYKIVKRKFDVSQFIKSFILARNIGPNSDGTFGLGKIYAFCMPWFFGADYLLTLIKDDEPFRDSLAKMEGGILVKFNQIAGITDPSKIISRILMIFGASALGSFKLISKDKCHFIMSSDFEANFDEFYTKEDLFLLKRNVALIICGAYEFAYDINVDFCFDGTNLHLIKKSDGRNLTDLEKEISNNLNVRNFMFKI